MGNAYEWGADLIEGALPAGWLGEGAIHYLSITWTQRSNLANWSTYPDAHNPIGPSSGPRAPAYWLRVLAVHYRHCNLVHLASTSSITAAPSLCLTLAPQSRVCPTDEQQGFG
jgi:hypothetical protein